MNRETDRPAPLRIGPGAAFAHGCCRGFRPSSALTAAPATAQHQPEHSPTSANDPQIEKSGAGPTVFP